MSSRRSQQNKDGKKSALELLKRSRKGEKNIREFDSSNSAFYEELDDADYDNVRREYNDFVEDDDGSGYVDNGQIETNYYSDEEPEVKVKKPNTSRKVNAAPTQPTVKPEHTLPQMFKRSTATSYGANFSSKRAQLGTKVKTEDAGDDMLNSILNQMDTRKTTPSTSKFSASLGSSTGGIRSALNQNSSRPQQSSSNGQSSALRSGTLTNHSTTQRPSTSGISHTEIKEELADPALLFSDTEDTNDISQHLEDTHLDSTEPSTSNQKDLKLDTKEDNNAMEVDEPVQKEKPQWMQIQQSMQNTNTEPNNEGIEEELWDDQLASNDGELIMYWIDAVEHNGVVYIFGKTYNSETKQFTSCSVKVDNLHRCLHFLPRGGKFKSEDDEDDESDKEEGDENDNEEKSDLDENDSEKQKKEELFTYEELRNEVMEIYSKYNITGRKGFRKISKKYAFEDKTVPLEAEYLYTVYPFDMPALPTNLEGKHFSKVFGANTSALELLLVQQKLMGPGWIKITNCEPSDRQVTYCAQEYISHGYKSVKPLVDEELEPLRDRLPPLRVVGITIKTIYNPETKVNEISMAHLICYNQVDITKDTQVENLKHENLSLIRQIPGTVVTDTVCQKLKQGGIDARICTNESMLLNALMAWITQKDPDVFVGHNLIEFGLDVLLTRLRALSIKMWSKIGRLRRNNWPKGAGEGGSVTRGIVSGRLLCDTYLGAKDTVKSKNYTLATLSEIQLGITKETIEYERIMEYYETSDQLIHLVKQGDFDSFLTVKLMFKLQLLPLSLQLTNLAGNLWTRTLTGGKAERNEYLLLHEFYNRGYIVPDKEWGNKKLNRQETESESIEVTNTTSSRRKPAYEGGLVLEPKKGLYDKITLLLDFNSLYPSIIQEFNICFTTVERPDDPNSLPEVPNSDLEQGILPQLLSFLVERRRNVKQMMKDPKLSKEKQNQLNIRQMALKLTANSMYGCLGFTFSRFYAKPLAMLITSRGREILQNTVQTATEEGLDVIYGDTDSIMIYTGLDNIQEAHKIGKIFKQKINQKYKLLELDTDGLYNKMLLLRKKKYAALIKDGDKPDSGYTLETKGLDMVRRDWCELSRNMSKYVLDLLLGGDDQDLSLAQIHSYLTEMGNQIKLGKVPIEQFVVDKGLTKNPELYGDASIHPHVQVALQLKKRGIIVKPGDTVPYVICDTQNTSLVNENSTKHSSGYASRAYHPEEVKSNPSLKLDYNWYLANQIHPPLARLFEPIEGTDEAHIAECLGLDPNRYRGNSQSQQSSLISTTLQSITSDTERFRNMPKLNLECPNNHGEYTIDQLITHKDGAPVLAVECPNEECKWMPRPETIAYKLEQILRTELRQLNSLWVRCDDSSCGYRTRSISVRNTHQGLGRGCPRSHCEGRLFLENSPSRFYNILAYFEQVFNEQQQIVAIKDKLINKDNLPEKESFASLYRLKVKDLLRLYGDKNQRRFVNLGDIFKYSATNTNGGDESTTKVY